MNYKLFTLFIVTCSLTIQAAERDVKLQRDISMLKLHGYDIAEMKQADDARRQAKPTSSDWMLKLLREMPYPDYQMPAPAPIVIEQPKITRQYMLGRPIGYTIEVSYSGGDQLSLEAWRQADSKLREAAEAEGRRMRVEQITKPLLGASLEQFDESAARIKQALLNFKLPDAPAKKSTVQLLAYVKRNAAYLHD